MNETDIIITIFYLVAFIFFYKYIVIYKSIKNKEIIIAKCTNFIIREFYNKKEYIAYYLFTLDQDECKASDKSRLPFIKYIIKNNMNYNMYVNPKNEKDYVSPYDSYIYKYYLLIALVLIIFPILLFK